MSLGGAIMKRLSYNRQKLISFVFSSIVFIYSALNIFVFSDLQAGFGGIRGIIALILLLVAFIVAIVVEHRGKTRTDEMSKAHEHEAATYTLNTIIILIPLLMIALERIGSGFVFRPNMLNLLWILILTLRDGWYLYLENPI